MVSPKMARLRATIAVTDFRCLTKAQQRRRTKKVLKAFASATADPKILAAFSARQKADRRRELAFHFSRSKVLANKTASNLPNKTASNLPKVSRRHVYGSADMDAYDYFTLRSGMKSAAKQERRQKGFPNSLRHPTTIHLCILPLDADMIAETNAIRPRLRETLSGLTTGVRVDGAFQNEILRAEDLAKIFPKSEWPKGFDPVSEPDRHWALLHIHIVICDPWLTKNEIRRHLKKEYAGSNRVNIRRVMPVIQLADATVTRGAQGFLEYARIARCRAVMKTKKDTADALIEFMRLETTWSGKSKGFKFGKTLEDSGVIIDLNRVKFIEAQDRAQWVKDHWHELGYAERFFHLWFSGIIGISLTDESLVGTKGRGSSYICLILDWLSNWVSASSAKDIDFSRFLRVRLRE